MSQFTTVIIVPGEGVHVEINNAKYSYTYVDEQDTVTLHLGEEEQLTTAILPIPEEDHNKMREKVLAKGCDNNVEFVHAENIGWLSF